ADAGRRVVLVDQEPEASLGGQAFWSFGGLFLVDSPEQRRLRRRASHELAGQDWLGTAGFDRPDDEWPRRWAQAYVDFAAGEKRGVLAGAGLKWWAQVRWDEGRKVGAKRGLGGARRVRRDRARQLGPALPRHVGHRAGRRGAVRTAHAGGRQAL